MKTLCIVPCGARKIWQKKPDAGPQKARDVYIGPYASKCIEYAKTFYPDSWCILSAKYGFLFPDDIIPGPYNVTFNKKSTNPITEAELKLQVVEKGLYYDQIISIGGKNYTDLINQIFISSDIITPLVGKALGVSIGEMSKAIKGRIPINADSKTI